MSAVRAVLIRICVCELEEVAGRLKVIYSIRNLGSVIKGTGLYQVRGHIFAVFETFRWNRWQTSWNRFKSSIKWDRGFGRQSAIWIVDTPCKKQLVVNCKLWLQISVTLQFPGSWSRYPGLSLLGHALCVQEEGLRTDRRRSSTSGSYVTRRMGTDMFKNELQSGWM